MKRNFYLAFKVAFLFAFIFVFLLCGASMPVVGQDDISLMPGAIPQEIKTFQDEAQGYYSEAFNEVDDAKYRQAAQVLESLIGQYGADPTIEEAYFYAADIYYARLQGEQNCRAAIRILEKLQENIPNANKILNAKFTIALIYYRYLNDPKSATEVLDDYFDSLSFHDYLESEKLQAQILLAKCYQKRGGYANEKKIWDALQITNPKADRTGRNRFLNNIGSWKRLPGQDIVLFFTSDIPERAYRGVLQSAEKELAKLIAKFNRKPPGPIEVFLYTNTDAMLLHTSLEEPLTIDGDREIHLAADQADEIPYLMAMVYSSALNNRSRTDRHPLMRGGFDMALYTESPGEPIDRLAARQLSLFDTSPGSGILLGTSNFFGSAEYNRLAGSFCKYLLDNESVDAFMYLFRGLYPHHTRAMVEAAFEKQYGKPLDQLVAGWYASVSPVIAQLKAELGSLTYDLTPVQVDLSTPLKALDSWYEALRKGDFDALIKSSTPDLQELLKEAKEAYEKEGILDDIVIEQFVYPYYPTTYEIIRSGELGEDIFLFKISIVKDGEAIDEKDVTLRKIGGKWYIDVNP